MCGRSGSSLARPFRAGMRKRDRFDFGQVELARGMVDVEPDNLWIKDGKIYTSAGITTGMHLAVALVEGGPGSPVRIGTGARVGDVPQAAGRTKSVFE